jgi:hypothetical protein
MENAEMLKVSLISVFDTRKACGDVTRWANVIPKEEHVSDGSATAAY